MSVDGLLQRIPVRKPFQVGLLALIIALAFCGARWAIVADHDTSRFVVAGEVFVDPAQTPVHLHTFAGTGYDGQFYWRLANDPTNLHVERADGVLLDGPMRTSRIAYPTLAWALSLGNARWVSLALIGVNVLAFGLLAWVGAALARRSSRHVLYGLLVASATGLVMSLARDLIEVVMVAAIVGGIHAVRERRWGLAALAWSVAVLSHEQCLFVIGAYALWRMWTIARKQSRAGWADVAWVLPSVVYGTWQLIAREQVGALPIRASGSGHIVFPFQGLGKAVFEWVQGDIERQALLVFPQLAVLGALLVLTYRARSTVAVTDRWILFVLAAGAGQAICLSYGVWEGPAELRQIVLVPTLACVAIVVSKLRVPTWLFAGVALVWLATAGLRVVAI
ncbi:MAG: hypothetical protein Q7V57_12735 [Actinomycetota bacterium]|nr:hypothetical protein [Actinomycetota bacterium]